MLCFLPLLALNPSWGTPEAAWNPGQPPEAPLWELSLWLVQCRVSFFDVPEPLQPSSPLLGLQTPQQQ